MFILLCFTFTPSPSYPKTIPKMTWPTPSPSWMPRRTLSPTKSSTETEDFDSSSSSDENNESSMDQTDENNNKAFNLQKSKIIFIISFSLLILFAILLCVYLSKRPSTEALEMTTNSPPLLEETQV